MKRRSFLRGVVAGAVVAPAAGLLRGEAATTADLPVTVATDKAPDGLKARLDAEIRGYMQAMYAPGMGFTVTDLKGREYTAGYGFEDLKTKTAMSPERLFEIGSISKSMAAVLVLQLVDEGRLDLQRPVLEDLPWLPWKTSHGAVTLHHVLTHTSGMPNGGPLFFARNEWVHEQRYAPGKKFFYSNMVFNVLGHLIAKCDGRSYQESLWARLLQPLGMASSRPQIGGGAWKMQAVSYIPSEPDEPYHPGDALREAPAFHEESSAGCVLSKPADMAKYLRFLLRGGVTDDGKRLVSEAGFAKMTTPHVECEEFGKTASYGYGVAVDTYEGDKVLLHTGGMVSFMSAMHLNLTRGTASFASINAQLDYRPKPVTKFAMTALAASVEGKALPAPIELPPAKAETHEAKSAAVAEEVPAAWKSFVGHYVSDEAWGGSTAVVVKDGKLTADGVVLTPRDGGGFYLESEKDSADRVEFACVVNGEARVLLVNGTPMERFHPWSKAKS